MLILKPIPHETIWGGNKLLPYIDERREKLGHLYSLISNGEFESVIQNGKYTGKTLREYFDSTKRKWVLENYSEFPFVIALVDPKEDLSIQVHPNDECANQLENRQFGKNESWYFIEPPTERWLFNGSRIKTIDEIKEKIEIGRVEEDVIDRLEIQKGDYVFVEQGTIHAATHGALFYEIEENCNLTYRFYDFNRKDTQGRTRELHIDKALKAINPSLKSITKKYNGKEIRERFYSTKLYETQKEYKNTSNTIECLTILEGASIVDDIKVQTGTTIILEPEESIELTPSSFIIARPITGEEK